MVKILFGKKRKAVTAEEREAEIKREEEKAVNDANKLSKNIIRSEKSVRRYQTTVLRLLVFIAVVWILFFQVIGLMRMPTGDMYPRIDAGDMLLFYRLDKDVKAQDVIVINKATPESPKTKTNFVCRVIAVAGDTVDINTESGRVSVNGNTLIESNIFYDTPQYEGYTTFPVTIPEGQCFVLADKRSDGADSRYFGLVSRNEIVGTVITIMRRNSL